MNIKLAKQLSAIGNGYSGCWIDSDYGKVIQRWLLVTMNKLRSKKRASLQ
ncbi:hypothetical protein VCRA2113O119_270010 [Vibrio crassostreae]|uniref:Uncharacterized protein n=1 Tax=Vibrio crassostreae TaxID=246167 RepID=A0A822MSC7_9VIBR|nr:hypothetical protein VCRA2113O119_270010 [Vibrio crassostreae]CAK2375221.1 hypothetical protein VCRA2117O143_530003 [Vibrio crassostreae]CAK2375377.1 hypothetical protein VCRA2117O142_510003 [Vibrio crassostreae]CAK3022280.1 hypothetical protein VCRA215O110_440008 [Vibrio crassostreae]CAK3373692.1 hypothetical protein VCRA2120E126_230056 [Vibrio crassostreae]